MHPNNPYFNNSPDFRELAASYPSFRPYVSSSSDGHAYIDFKDPAALRELTRCLLLRDFQLNVELPEDRLCPTLANRLDYICHLLSLVEHVDPSVSPDGENLRVLDIGTGATAIYSILLARLRKSASITATEIDDTSLLSAHQTVARNEFRDGQIRVKKAQENEGILFTLREQEARSRPYTFTMCNPPFYASQSEISALTELKLRPAHAGPTASMNELITEGGEVAFVGKMMEESWDLRDRCRWFTSLLGKAASISPLVEKLRTLEVDNYFLLSIRQAHTSRWIIGWSYTDVRLPDTLVRVGTTSTVKYLPKPNHFTFEPPPTDLARLRAACICAITTSGLALDSAAVHTESELSWILAPTAVTWSRAARRQAQRGEAEAVSGAPAEPLFVCRVRVREDSIPGSTDEGNVDMEHGNSSQSAYSGPTLEMDWLKGKDRKTLEAFWTFLVRKVGDTLRVQGDASMDITG